MSIRTSIACLQERMSGLEQLIQAEKTALRELMTATFTTLRTVVDANADQVEIALKSSQTAIDKADASDEKARDRLASEMSQRFDSVNEFRRALNDSQVLNVTRQEFDQFRAHYTEQHALLRDRYAQEIADLKGRLDKAEGRQGGVQGVWGVIVAVVGIAIAIGALVFRNMGG